MPVALTRVLARRDGVAVCLRRVDVYREGCMFALSVRASRPLLMTDDEWADVMDKVQPHRSFRRIQTDAPFRLGVELSDGSKVFANEMAHRFPFDAAPPDRSLLTMNGGGGGGSEDEYNHGMSAWLWPSPPSGSIRLVYDWADLGFPEGSIAFDAAPLISARDEVQTIWPD